MFFGNLYENGYLYWLVAEDQKQYELTAWINRNCFPGSLSLAP